MESRNYPEEIDLQKYWLVLKRRWLVVSGIFVASVGLAAFAASLEEAQYQASGKLLFQTDRVASLTGVGENIGELEALTFQGNPLETQAVVVKSLPILQETVEALNLTTEDGMPLPPKALADSLSVETVSGTDVMEISYRSDDPELSAAVVNQVMESFIANDILSNRAKAAAAGEFIGEQLPRTEDAVDQAAEELRQFKAQNQIISLQEEASAVVDLMANLDQQINQTQSELSDISTQSVELSRQLGMSPQQALSLTSLSQAPGVQEVLTQLQQVQSQLATQRALYTSRHPAIANLERQEASLSSLLQARVGEVLGSGSGITAGELQIGQLEQTLAQSLIQTEVQRLGLQSRVNALSNLRQAYRTQADVLPALEKQQRELERRLAAAQTTYESLLIRLQEIQVAENQNVGNARIIQPAVVPANAVESSRKLYLGMGGFAGLLLGIAAAFFVDLVDRSVKTVKEAQDLFGYTLLGLIPRFEANTATQTQILNGVSPRVIVASSPRTPIHEAYQMLQANLKFISSDQKIRTIVVTSSVPKEGKSEVCANLAAAIAQVGRRVLLVDADMRHPSQHHLWGLVNTVGLSNVIVGQDEFSQAVQEVTSNLSVLTAGVMPPNPLALIDSERMAALTEMFAREYDYVLFDTSPLAGTADAAVLGKLADGVLLVVQPGVVDSASAGAAKSLLARSEPNILGIVANGVHVRQEPDSYFYYSNTQVEQTFDRIEPARTTKV
jgi:succinoglycan biosynthesis transport protein ExoP